MTTEHNIIQKILGSTEFQTFRNQHTPDQQKKIDDILQIWEPSLKRRDANKIHDMVSTYHECVLKNDKEKSGIRRTFLRSAFENVLQKFTEEPNKTAQRPTPRFGSIKSGTKSTIQRSTSVKFELDRLTAFKKKDHVKATTATDEKTHPVLPPLISAYKHPTKKEASQKNEKTLWHPPAEEIQRGTDEKTAHSECQSKEILLATGEWITDVKDYIINNYYDHTLHFSPTPPRAHTLSFFYTKSKKEEMDELRKEMPLADYDNQEVDNDDQWNNSSLQFSMDDVN